MFHHHSDNPLLPPAFYSAAARPNTGFFNGSASYNPLYLGPTTSSQSPSYSSSLPSCHLLRTSSTLSLHSHITDPTPQSPFLSSSPSSPCTEPVRRVFSTGDLQGMNGMQASAENGSQVGTAILGKVRRYSAEERKERIERYRSKRNHRNFQKKITYACRKTLADSRPRVRGRFARNGETEAEIEVEAVAAVEASCDAYNYNASEQTHNSYEQSQNDGGGAGAGHDGEWWGPLLEALATEEEDECCCDEDVWANYLTMLSMNLL